MKVFGAAPLITLIAIVSSAQVSQAIIVTPAWTYKMRL